MQFCCDGVVHGDAVEDVKKKLESPEDYEALAALMKMFADKTRVNILHALEQRELCVCDLASLLGLTKSAVSHQLKDLRLSRLVKNRRDGQTVFYSLADDHVGAIIDLGFEHLRE
ncbi:MAG: helix-turn-helix transcriptional regulator [Clostridia bacterium]|nr:helix-turn-helix transcriptional regulator [Clostridia bacterium]